MLRVLQQKSPWFAASSVDKAAQVQLIWIFKMAQDASAAVLLQISWHVLQNREEVSHGCSSSCRYSGSFCYRRKKNVSEGLKSKE
jgi:hypothetical protein